MTVDGTSTIPLGQFTELTNGSITDEGGSYALPLLSDINGLNIDVEDGGSLTLPDVTRCTNTSDVAYFQTSGTGSVLDLPALTALAAEYTDVEASGQGSLIELPAMTSFAGTIFAGLSATDGAMVIDPDLNDYTDVNLTTSPSTSFTLTSQQTYTLTPGALLSFTGGTLVEQGTMAVPDNAAFNLFGSLTVDGLGVLSLTPGATLTIKGNLLGNTTNADAYRPLGTVEFDGDSATSPLAVARSDVRRRRGSASRLRRQLRLRHDQCGGWRGSPARR